MQTLNQIRAALALAGASLHPDYPALLADLGEHKKAAVAAGDQPLAKHIWCLEHTIEAQQLFLKAYRQLQDRAYFDAWCTLEQVELALGRLRPHFDAEWQHYRLAYMEKIVLGLQSLFPYKIFMSPELLEEEKLCSICNKPVTIRNPCGHKVGEVYDGQYCVRSVTKFRVLGAAMVKNPVQKYSVPFYVDQQTGKTQDCYNYISIEHLVKRWPSPWADWNVKWTKRLHPKSKFGQLGRNDMCPCESQKKYKKCCLSLNGIMRPHAVFDFTYTLPEHLQTTEYSY
jgi:hypothetical protein